MGPKNPSNPVASRRLELPMMNPGDLARTVDEHKGAYELLQWIASAYRKNSFSPLDVRHACDSEAESTARWLDLHFSTLPSRCRPADRERETLRRFANLLSSYLVTSFDFDQNPGTRRKPTCGGWCCVMCSYLVELVSLKPKQLTKQHKLCAERLKRDYVKQLALDSGSLATEATAEAVCQELREDVAMATYGRGLLRRAEGHVEGPALLALWRQFAWTRGGSPKKAFALEAAAILAAERRVLASLTPLSKSS